MGGRRPQAWSTGMMSVGLFVCVGVCMFVTCVNITLGVIIWVLVSLYCKQWPPGGWSKSGCFG